MFNQETDVFDLSSIKGLAAFYLTFRLRVASASTEIVEVDSLHCPACGDKRRMRFRHILGFHKQPEHTQIQQVQTLEEVVPIFDSAVADRPILSEFICVQCRTEFAVLLYQGADKKANLVILPNSYGGLATPHASAGVAYYLDQAYKAQSVGANSAAVAMYRGALEHLLFEQGYTKGMLGNKITKLEEDIAVGTAPKWALELETEYLDVIKELGNGSIHPNDGKVELQAVLDNNLLTLLGRTFRALTLVVYEAQYLREENLRQLQEARSLLNKGR